MLNKKMAFWFCLIFVFCGLLLINSNKSKPDISSEKKYIERKEEYQKILEEAIASLSSVDSVEMLDFTPLRTPEYYKTSEQLMPEDHIILDAYLASASYDEESTSEYLETVIYEELEGEYYYRIQFKLSDGSRLSFQSYNGTGSAIVRLKNMQNKLIAVSVFTPDRAAVNELFNMMGLEYP
ncbi:MAG: hypothetical protein II376_08175 [Clostridia bacterium]|nr:hypothetical protein [Clostridia bacterium]